MKARTFLYPEREWVKNSGKSPLQICVVYQSVYHQPIIKYDTAGIIFTKASVTAIPLQIVLHHLP